MLSDTGSMLNGSEMPSPVSQLMPMVPVIGTLSGISSVGVKRRMMVVVSVVSIDGSSSGVTDVSQLVLGSTRLIFPVAPFPVLVILSG